MNYLEKYDKWIKNADSETVKELIKIKDNKKEIEDRFYQTLEFGTGGLRGVMAAGTNRMNIYVIRQATRALAQVIVEEKRQQEGVVIAYDCRINSNNFAKHCAEIFAGHGIKTYIFDDLRPTPELSFAIRYLKTVSGINVTASHNPKEYNGYKAYWDQGSQILDDIALRIQDNIKKINLFDDSKIMPFDKGIKQGVIEIIGKEVDDAYSKKVLSLTLNDINVKKDINIVYTPFNGTGIKFIPDILKERGFNNVTLVKEQMTPDGNFPTTPYPNPEDTKNFEYSLKYANKVDADLVLASDPDADRMAIMIKDNNNQYIALNGNQTGVLLINYILSQRKIKGLNKPSDALVKSIVTGDMGIPIAKDNGVTTFETLTGFKHICGLANEFEKTGDNNFVFGYEESIGYCPETFARDKDAVSTAMLIAEMCGYYMAKGKTLYQVLYELYEQYGYYKETQFSIFYRGVKGAIIKAGVMKYYREKYPKTIGGVALIEKIDYLNDDTGMPPSNVLKFRFEDGSWYAVRPSGTEPKLKTYIYTSDSKEKTSSSKLANFEKEIKKELASIERIVENAQDTRS
ncbi:MAG: phospho-sugar mutase [Clostridiales bacterium]|nr:phospho-sugar mutase [Clostridiales bacterium]